MDERTGSESLKREEELDRKFLTSGQEKVKLEIALMRYFELAKDKNKDSLMEIINKFRAVSSGNGNLIRTKREQKNETTIFAKKDESGAFRRVTFDGIKST